jgi:RNA polymerase sigma factor (sigma-70 family)
LARWRAGDQQAATELFGRYASRLTALARSRLSDRLTRRIDPEDVVQSVYRTFFAEARAGRYELARGGDLWRLLVTITLHKLYDQARRDAAGKRTGTRECNFGSEDSLMLLHLGSRHRPSPLEAAAVAEELEALMASLQAEHRRMLELRLQGYNLEEIAAELECSQRTVIRVLERIKKKLRGQRVL